MSFATGCRSRPKDPETEIREFIARAEMFAEKEDLGELRALFADDFRGKGRYSKQQLVSMINFQFLRRQKIFVLSRISQISFPTERTATVDLLAALTGRPVNSPDELKSLRADLVKFKLTLAKDDGEWAITAAHWSRANMRSLLEASGLMP
ncbi:MAG: hypothetical protein VYA30_07130 [Myxococcota bacterium]|nr:hypothetical protein [Myxococcota bacterium]